MNKKTETVGLGLSGGTDSAAAALFLLEAGYHVIGYTMKNIAQSEQTVEKAAAVAGKLGIQHRVIDLQAPFYGQVLKKLIDGYAGGFTPSPCVLCNRAIKFGALQDAILADGCDWMATGHYATIRRDPDGTHLFRGSDAKKDQSYFLAQLTQDQLKRVLFPLGGKLKAELKPLVKERGIIPQTEGESQDLCFVPNGGLGNFLNEKRPDLAVPGWIADATGKRLGRHHGAWLYTPGQRRGLGLGGGPWFVLKIDVTKNLVIVGHQEELGIHQLTVDGLNWLESVDMPLACQVQVRYLMRPRSATVTPIGPQRAILHLEEPVDAAPPGQLAVFYRDDQVLGSGWIERNGDPPISGQNTSIQS